MENTGIITKKKPTPTLPKGRSTALQVKHRTQSEAPPPFGGGPEELVTLREPTDKEFEQVCAFINEFELDCRNLKKEQFITAFRGEELAGFGRIREHTDCFELCSLGVVTKLRRKGIGKAIVKKLIKGSSKNIYLVCIIPEFFIPFGFQVMKEYPASIQNKIKYCSLELAVPETYVAMLLHKYQFHNYLKGVKC